MKVLRAFLYSREPGGACEVTVFREMEPLVAAATSIVAAPQHAAAIHTGFWRPDTADVAALLASWPGSVLMSAAACGAFPSPLHTSMKGVGWSNGAEFRLVLDGFGYCVADPTINVALSGNEPSGGVSSVSSAPEGWVAQAASLDPRLAAEARGAGVWDEASYQAFEAELSPRLRWNLGLARMAALANCRPDPIGILDSLWASPPWFMEFPLAHLHLQVRQINVFRAHGCSTVADISSMGANGLMKLPNMGQGSVSHVGRELHSALMNGAGLPRADAPSPVHGDASVLGIVHSTELSAASPTGPFDQPSRALRAEFLALADLLGDKQFEIWTSRLGYGREPETLQQIADRMDVTRERIRQIEAKVHQKLQFHPLWLALADRLEKALSGRDSALLIDGLSAVDSWFDGAESFATALADIFEHLMGRRFGAFKIAGSWVVSQITHDDWNDACRSARSLLESCADDGIEEDYARSLCDGLLVGKGEELCDDLWDVATERAVWSTPVAGARRLVAFGRGAEGIVRAVLESSDKPLHYSEIHRRASAMASPPHDVRSIVNTANAVGYLYGRGTYGLLSHCPLDREELTTVVAELEDAMAVRDASRQWHASELCEEMHERGLGFDGRLTKYVVNIALAQSESAVDLGRMVWAVKGVGDRETAPRLDVRQAVIALLVHEGKPMSTAAIRAKLVEGRGLDQHFQISPSEALLRIGPGLWGLADRDIDADAANAFLASLRAELDERQRGLHVSEIPSALGLLEGCEIDRSRFTLADRFGVRIDRGQYAYLAAWGSSRRISVPEAARTALAEMRGEGIAFDDICKRVARITEREVLRSHVSQALRGIDAEIDALTGLWTLAPPQALEFSHEGSA